MTDSDTFCVELANRIDAEHCLNLVNEHEDESPLARRVEAWIASSLYSEPRTIYRVAVDCESCTVGPHKIHVLVVSNDPHEALDRATEHDNASRLWDEDIQRRIADGEEPTHRDYQGLLEEAEYVGAV